MELNPEPWSKAYHPFTVLFFSLPLYFHQATQHLPEANESVKASFSHLNSNIWAQRNTESPRMLRVALMSNRLPNRMSCLPAALPIQISAAQWNLNSTHNCVTKSKTVNVSSHYCISPSKYHIIQLIILWISNTNMLPVDILSYLHKALRLINKRSGLLPVITGIYRHVAA